VTRPRWRGPTLAPGLEGLVDRIGGGTADRLADRVAGELAVGLHCCAALAATVPRLVRPRQADDVLLARLDAELAPMPPVRQTVRASALIQASSLAPMPFVAEGVVRPPQAHLGFSTIVVEHPETTVIVDPALCVDVHTRVLPGMPWLARQLLGKTGPIVGLADALDRVGRTAGDLGFALATHLHWDHVSGLSDIPSVELRTTSQELTGLAALPARVRPTMLRDSMVGVRPRLYDLDGPPVLTFPASHDLFGDGSVVVVDLAGHTAGSVGVLLALADGRRVLLCGDAAWHRRQISDIREKAPLPGRIVDADREATWVGLHRLHALPPEIEVVPAHDLDATIAVFGSAPL
jgi:N-acyl homoserine lactone hydrolase